MTKLETARAVVLGDPANSIKHELANDASKGLKCDYYSVRSGDDRELLQIDRATSDQLAREGIVRAGPFDQEARVYRLRQTGAAH